MLTRRMALKTLVGGSVAMSAAGPRKPNLIIFLADDLGYGDIRCYGSPDVPTPYIDAIARNGVRCTDGYVSAAVCSPSRAALLSGQHQQRFGHEFNSGSVAREAEVNFGLPKGVKIFPQYLKPAGYVSGIFGKWHLGVRPGYHPLERGFDEYFGFLPGADDYVNGKTPSAEAIAADGDDGKVPLERAHHLLRGHEVADDDRYLTDALAAEAASFVERHKDRPFFLYLAFNAVHTPLQATGKYLDRFPTIRDPKHRMLAAMTAALDDAVGTVMEKVRQHGLERDTMIVFLSDNGCPEMTGAGTNGPLNGEKVTYFEGGIRIPYIVQWTGRLPAGKTYRQPVVSRDLLPTFAKAAGIALPQDVPFDGVDLLPYLAGQKSGVPHEALFWRAGHGRAVRKGKWKLLQFGDEYTRLFDLSADLGEKHDISAKHPEVVRELKAEFESWSANMQKPAWPPRFREVVVNGEKINWEL